MGPRIYNLFPTLAGSIALWETHLDRIAAMGFNWVYVNPIHATGGSGSLYAIADYFALSAHVRGDDASDDDELVAGFVRAAEARGLRVMLDLVINHTANDSPLVHEHSSWYVRSADGTLVAPAAAGPTDPHNVTVWGDLAEIDFTERPALRELTAYFARVVRHYVGLGVRGFRCDAAYKVPAGVWSDVIAAGREVFADALFAAETLGCRAEDVARLGHAGFDYLFNSSKWWDFHASWLLEQYETFRHIAPSIAFPESHDTPRLAAELAGRSKAEIEAEYKFRYLFAAFFSSGVMLPMGYEFGFERKLDVVATRPSDWEAARFDISPFIAAVNRMKAALPALNEEGSERDVSVDGTVVALLRRARTSSDVALGLLNPAPAQRSVRLAGLCSLLGGAPHEVTPGANERSAKDANETVTLAPLEIRVFVRSQDAQMRVEHALANEAGVDALARSVVIEDVTPQLDGGRHPIKRVVGDDVVVEADIFREGHDALRAILLFRERGEPGWQETPMTPLDNDRYRGAFRVERNVPYEYTLEAWPDAFATWRHDVAKKLAAGQPLETEALEGRALLEAARDRSDDPAPLAEALRDIAALPDDLRRIEAMLGQGVDGAAARAPERRAATRYEPPLRVDVDRRAAQFAAWYELFPRSLSGTPGVHGTFADAARRLPEIRALGFDVVYLAPIHPIGHAFRKGRNNALDVAPEDPGSPWAIGNADGGHTAVEPKLGTLDDFDRFVTAARVNGLEVALDYALQCSPDHPFVREHPEWFTFRPDGSIKYAENPPKKYQDIVNFNWFGAHRAALWNALRDIVLFWIGHGIHIFRVDNPHTKPFAFWEWMIAAVRARYPDTIFLAEAFTRPKVMNELAKIGFAQSYTYFTWRTSKAELTEYVTELARSELMQFYRPHFWPNTPDILPPYLQTGGRPAFRIRLVLAATLSSLYGIYSGYEVCENAALPGREEYADSEKYELKVRDWDAPGNINDEIAALNRIRRENAALQDWRNVTFYRADDDAVLFYGKRRGRDVLLIAVNLDPFAPRDATLWLPTEELGFVDNEPYDVMELLGGTHHLWRGSAQRWRLDPQLNPAAIFRVRARSES
ncbi:MAG: DUF3416 domain-containing protein [Candidatus Eremiobacteraeota bacterium]|nr:DUF3416 domain-containing protein [Candidatus Eremiobacteraeota bacterium]